MLLTEGLLVGVFALACCGLVFFLRAFLCACAWLSFLGWLCVFIVSLLGSPVFVESLILAQDERWRRA